VIFAAEQHGAALPGWQALLVMVTVGIIVGGRFLMRPVFRFIAATRLQEILRRQPCYW